MVEKTKTSQPNWQTFEEPLYTQLEPILVESGKQPVYSLLVKSPEALAVEKRLFFNAQARGEAYNPNLTPDKSGGPAGRNEAEMRRIKQIVKETPSTSAEEAAVKMAYRWKINEEIANQRLAQAALHGDMRRFQAYNRFIYGEPKPELFAEEVNTIRSQAEVLAGGNTPAKAAAKEVLRLLPAMDSQEPNPIDEETFKQIQALHIGYFATALAGVEVPSKVQPETGMAIVEKVLENLGAKTEPFNYKVKPVDSETASVNSSDEEVRYPKAKTYDRERFIGLFPGHEVGRHVRERLNGYQSKFKLLRLSMDRATAASEGKGVLSEQIAYPTYEAWLKQPRARQVMLRHLAAGLAVGTDGQPRDFHSVYQIIEPIYRMYGLAEAKSPGAAAAAVKSARDDAWNLLAKRILKGSRGKGSAYLKDMVYAEGNRAYWQLAKEHPQLTKYWDLGKLDLANPRHIQVLQALDVLPTQTDEMLE